MAIKSTVHSEQQQKTIAYENIIALAAALLIIGILLFTWLNSPRSHSPAAAASSSAHE